MHTTNKDNPKNMKFEERGFQHDLWEIVHN